MFTIMWQDSGACMKIRTLGEEIANSVTHAAGAELHIGELLDAGD